jgi:hypothetical protein
MHHSPTPGRLLPDAYQPLNADHPVIRITFDDADNSKHPKVIKTGFTTG